MLIVSSGRSRHTMAKLSPIDNFGTALDQEGVYLEWWNVDRMVHVDCSTERSAVLGIWFSGYLSVKLWVLK